MLRCSFPFGVTSKSRWKPLRAVGSLARLAGHHSAPFGVHRGAAVSRLPLHLNVCAPWYLSRSSMCHLWDTQTLLGSECGWDCKGGCCSDGHRARSGYSCCPASFGSAGRTSEPRREAPGSASARRLHQLRLVQESPAERRALDRRVSPGHIPDHKDPLTDGHRQGPSGSLPVLLSLHPHPEGSGHSASCLPGRLGAVWWPLPDDSDGWERTPSPALLPLRAHARVHTSQPWP